MNKNEPLARLCPYLAKQNWFIGKNTPPCKKAEQAAKDKLKSTPKQEG